MPGVYSAKLFRVACAALAGAGDGCRTPAAATSRIKDLANIEGVRQNQLIGYGLVVGLNGTGDTLNNIPFTKQSLQAMLERLGVNIRGADHPHRQRRRRDGDRQPAGRSAPRAPASTSRSRRSAMPRACRAARCWSRRCSAPTATSMRWRRARSRSAASRPRATPPRSCAACRPSAASPTAPSSSARSTSRSTGCSQVRLALRNPDFTTAKRIAAAINDFIGAKTAEPLDPSTVQLTIPPEFKGNVVVAADRDRAVAGRAGPRRQDRDRRALRHHRDGPRRARRPRSRWRRAISPSRSPKARRSASPSRCRAAEPS